MTKKNTTTRYNQIAVMIAEKIKNRSYPEGTKLNARSSLAVAYNTSPETVRRALNVLADLGIVEIRHGSGATVISRRKAKEFIDSYNNIKTLSDSRKEILESIQKQEQELEHFQTLLDEVFFAMRKGQDLYSLSPYDIAIDETCLCIGKTISELRFWARTEATVVGIKRGRDIMISPGPYAEICKDDILFFVGDENAKQLVHHLLYGTPAEETETNENRDDSKNKNDNKNKMVEKKMNDL